MERALDPLECMTDRFDLAGTLNFTIVAAVEGTLTDDALRTALRALEARHPILRFAIDRSVTPPRFVPDAAAEIPLVVREGDADLAQAQLHASLEHMRWADTGPRARLTAVRHDATHTTLLLTLHHTVSDGSSGIIAMRDLLRATQGSALGEPLPSPGPQHFLPPAFSDAGARVKAMLDHVAAPGAPYRPRDVDPDSDVPLAERRGVLRHITLSEAQLAGLTRWAKAQGVTLQSVLSAALLRAMAVDAPEPRVMRAAHPVSLRRHLPRYFPEGEPVGDRIGYYVSAVDTAVEVGPDTPLARVAADVATELAHAVAEAYPLLSGPVAGATLVEKTAALDDEAFRKLLEQQVMLSAFGLSNLGALEQLGMHPAIGALRITDCYFGMANSIFGAFGAGVTSLDGRCHIALRGVTPLMSEARIDGIAKHTERALLQLARTMHEGG